MRTVPTYLAVIVVAIAVVVAMIAAVNVVWGSGEGILQTSGNFSECAGKALGGDSCNVVGGGNG